MSFVYPGSKAEFYDDFGGLPERTVSLTTILVIVVIVILIIIAITAWGFLRTEQTTTFIDHEGFYNLDTLVDKNNATTQCCVFPGSTAPNEQYIFDTINGITYARQKPTSITTVCNSFPDPSACIADNTDSAGNIIPKVVFRALPYYTFENGLFVGCDTTTVCSTT